MPAPSSVDAETWIDRAAVGGLATFGVVHLVLGWLAVTLALGDRRGGASTAGAVRELAQQPFGGVLVWAVAGGMILLVVWQAAEATAGHQDRDRSSRTRRRATSAGKAIVYAVIGWSAIRIALGAGSNSERSTDTITARLLDLPVGPVLVAAVGLGIAAVGVALWVSAWRESYLELVRAEARTGRFGIAVRWLGRGGHVAKGLALGAVASLFVYAALTHDAQKSGGLDQALRRALDQPFGPALIVAIGVGFVAYGLFCLAEAAYLDR